MRGARRGPFYEVDGVPVHQVKLVRTRAEALNCAKGDIRMCFCASCGFVWNGAFDPARMRYEDDYEFDPGGVADLQCLSRAPGARPDRALRPARQEGGRARLRPGRVRHHARGAGRQPGLRLRPGDPPARQDRQGDLHQGPVRRPVSRPRARFRLLQDDARARARRVRFPARRAAYRRRPARERGLLHDPGGHADFEPARVLGHLLRALLVLEPGLARARVQDRRVRPDQGLDRLRRTSTC